MGLGAEVPSAPPPMVTCPPSAQERERLLALPFSTFDQDMQGGWRAYSNQQCYHDAANLLDAYATRNPDLPMLSVVRWHQVQTLAMADDKPGALSALAEVKRLDHLRGTDRDPGWMAYVLGTEAFLRGQKDELERQLTAIQIPMDFSARINANVMKGLLKCFGQPYKTAYTAPCLDLAAAQALMAERRKAAEARAQQQAAAPK